MNINDKITNTDTDRPVVPPPPGLRTSLLILPRCRVTVSLRLWWPRPLWPCQCICSFSICRRRSRTWRPSFNFVRKQSERLARESTGQIPPLHSVQHHLVNHWSGFFVSVLHLHWFCPPFSWFGSLSFSIGANSHFFLLCVIVFDCFNTKQLHKLMVCLVWTRFNYNLTFTAAKVSWWSVVRKWMSPVLFICSLLFSKQIC